ncbi:MAG: hypothetical protein B5M51_02385 [Anaerolinea sp. 4484_236]|nr:MAG: hypothetical protein B5M51_02385 [Anaerolinea sp. 4484_236]
MSKNKEFQNRLDKLLSDTELPQPVPEKNAQISAVQPEDKSDLESSDVQTKDRAVPPKDVKREVGWDQFLNAIDREERIGFSFDQKEITPLPLTGASPTSGEDSVEIPLQIGEKTLGKIQLEGERNWTSEDNQLIASIAQQMSQHIENLRLLEQTEQYRADAEEATRRLTQQGWEEYLQTPTALSLSHGYVYDQNRVIPYDAETKIVADAKIVSQDIAVREERIGQLLVADAEGEPQEVGELLSTVADNLSAHIENLRLLDETERGRQQLDKRAAELETVAKVSTAAAAIRDPKSLLKSVVDLTSFSFRLYHTSAYLLNENEDGSKTLDLFAASGKVGHKMLTEGHTIKLSEKKSVIAQAARTLEVVIVDDTSNDPLFLAHPLLPDTRSEMAIPMIVADQLIGILDVEADVANRFTEDDVRTYSTLASQTAVALQNAQLYAEQIKTVERLRELDRLKSSFLANMSHELRTPLNSISGFTQVLLEELDGPLTDEMQDDLGLIEKNAEHLLRLINEVLDMAKIEAGQMNIFMEPVNIHELLNDIQQTNEPLTRKNELTLELKNNIPVDLMMMADSMRLQQVMINLIGNAIKFTKKGGITIDAEKEKDNILVRIIDTGIGIPPNNLDTIFEAFSQVDSSTTRKAGGTGLGLPISRRFVEMHHGRLWAESTGIPGEGSTFVLELPIKLPEEKPAE